MYVIIARVLERVQNKMKKVRQNKMKNLESIVKAIEQKKVNFAEIVNCENVSVDELSDNERFSVAIFAELAKAINTRDYTLVLDCNYSQSKFHDSETFKVDYYRLVSNDTKNASMIQFYVSANYAKRTCFFHLCTSCAKMNREQFVALENELHFRIKYNKDKTRAKTSERTRVQYNEVCEVVKAVCAVLANSAKAKEQKEESKAE